MRISLNWLKAYVDVTWTVEELAQRLTMAGLEVSGIERIGAGIDEVVVGQILATGPHPNADRLSLCRVTDGDEVFDIVCGASNMEAGDKVALARVGVTLPGGVKIKKAKIRGQTSFGMMCSERELGFGDEHEGILILPPDTVVGRHLADSMGLPDSVLEVDLTPNRPDCLSVVGVAREVAALTGQSLRLPDPIVPEAGEPVAGQTSVEILDPDLCHRYAARVVRGIRLGPSPLWMRQRLQASAVRPINNVVDVTNYVLLELGHPLHAFDLHRLVGERIVVRRAGDGELFTTLDGQDRVLDAETLVICDGERPVAVAGIMGGLNSEVQEDTVDLLLESAYFEPRNIRRSSKRIGLQTEASYRFERGTDIEGLIRALDRSAELIVELAGGTVERGIWDAYPTAHERRRVLLRLGKVASVLGVAVPQAEVHGYLTALGIRVSEPSSDPIECEIPPHRVDLEREIDLIEEIARLYGYDAVPATVPSVAMRCEPYPAPLRLADAARDALQASGFQEAVTLSFIDPDEDDRLGYLEDTPLRAKVSLENPLNRETGVLRTSLLPGLLRGAGLNARRQARDVRLFEVGRTYHPVAGQELPAEVLRVGGILTGRRQPLSWWGVEEVVDFYDAKGAVEDFLRGLGIAGCRFAAAPDLPWLHAGRCARLSVGGAECGWVGELHPDRLGAYEIPPPAMAFELDLDALARVAEEPGPFTGLGKFPAVERDVALLLDRAVPAEAVLEAIDSLASPLIRSAVLFDAFEGGRIPPGKVSLAFRITYRTDERTLTEAEVMEVEQALLRRLEGRVGATLRTE